MGCRGGSVSRTEAKMSKQPYCEYCGYNRPTLFPTYDQHMRMRVICLDCAKRKLAKEDEISTLSAVAYLGWLMGGTALCAYLTSQILSWML